MSKKTKPVSSKAKSLDRTFYSSAYTYIEAKDIPDNKFEHYIIKEGLGRSIASSDERGLTILWPNTKTIESFKSLSNSEDPQMRGKFTALLKSLFINKFITDAKDFEGAEDKNGNTISGSKGSGDEVKFKSGVSATRCRDIGTSSTYSLENLPSNKKFSVWQLSGSAVFGGNSKESNELTVIALKRIFSHKDPSKIKEICQKFVSNICDDDDLLPHIIQNNPLAELMIMINTNIFGNKYEKKFREFGDNIPEENKYCDLYEKCFDEKFSSTGKKMPAIKNSYKFYESVAENGEYNDEKIIHPKLGKCLYSLQEFYYKISHILEWREKDKTATEASFARAVFAAISLFNCRDTFLPSGLMSDEEEIKSALDEYHHVIGSQFGGKPKTCEKFGSAEGGSNKFEKAQSLINLLTLEERQKLKELYFNL